MKKKALNAVLCICLAFLLFSCEGSLTERIDRILKMADGNIYIDSGWVKVDTSQVTEAMNQITSGETLEPSGDGTITVSESDKVKVTIESKDTEEGVSKLNVAIGENNITVDVKGKDPTFAAPLSDDKLEALNTTLGDVLSSPQKKEALVEELKKPVEGESKDATQNTFALTAAIAESMAGTYDVNDEANKGVKAVLEDLSTMANDLASADTITQSDVLSAQLVVGIASDIATLSTKSDITDKEKADLTAKILDQANTMINIANTEAGSFDVTKLDGLMDILGSSSSKADVNFSSEAIEQIVKYRPMVNGLAKDLLGYDNGFDEEKVNRIIASYKKAEIAQRIVLATPDVFNKYEFDLDGTLNYAVAVIVSSLDGFNKVTKEGETKYTPASALNEVISSNSWILADSKGNYSAIPEEFVISDTLKNAAIDGNKFSLDKLNDSGIVNKDTLLAQAAALDKVLGMIDSIPKDFKLADKLESLYNQGE